jgi:hypothetical protein
MSKFLNVGCGPHLADGWVNTDVIKTDEINPDVMVSLEDPFPFEEASFDRAYVGHVMEHMPWHALPDWLDKLASVLSATAEVMFVGPDTLRAIEGYRLGRTKWEEMLAIIENVTSYHGGEERWDEDRHQWNCFEQRVVDLLDNCGWKNIEPKGVALGGFLPELGDWPVVSQARCQFAVSANPPHFTV